MNQEQIIGALRVIIPVICSLLAPVGFSALGDPNFVAAITTVIVTIGAALWSVYSHTAAAKIRSAAAVDPGIKIQVPPRVMAENSAIHALVRDPNVPNVTPDVFPRRTASQ